MTKEQLAKYDFDEDAANITPIQKKGLLMAGLAELIYVIVLLLLSLPVFGPTAILADEAGSITGGNSPFTKGIVFSVTLALMIPGIVYGVTIGKYKNDKDIWADISQGFSEMGNYVFMCFLSPSSQISSLYPNWEPSWLSMGLDSFRISVSAEFR